jgi:phage N-6-adenine-methyltransferase
VSIILAGKSDTDSRNPLAAKNQTRTPRGLFDEQNAIYGFTLDAAASHENALVADYCTVAGSFGRDPAAPDWQWSDRDGVRIAETRHAGDGVAWINPPYGTGLILPFVEAWAKAYLRRGAKSVFLLPSRTEQPWFHEWVLPYAEIEWLRGRLRFDDHLGNPQAGAGFPCFLARFI